MLILFVNHSVAPTSLGGAERSMLRMVEEWQARDPDLDVHFLTKAPRGTFIAALEERGMEYTAFSYRGWAGSPGEASAERAGLFAAANYSTTLEIISLMERMRPDLVVTNTLVAPWGALAAKVVGVPHAWFVREYGDLDHGLTFTLGREATIRDISTLSDAIFTNSVALRSHLSQYIDVSNVSVVYPTVDAAHINAMATEPPQVEPFTDAQPSDVKLTVVGRVSESKGQWRLIDALANLTSAGVPARLCLVGAADPPSYRDELEERARARGVADRVTFTGHQDNPFPFVHAADVCVTPSGLEAFGRTTLEYMALGKPVVASASGGSSELVIDGETGYLFDPASTEDLASAVARFFGGEGDAAAMGNAARDRARMLSSSEYSNSAAIDRLSELAGTSATYRLPAITRHWFALLSATPPAVSARRSVRQRIRSIGRKTRQLFIAHTRKPKL